MVTRNGIISRNSDGIGVPSSATFCWTAREKPNTSPAAIAPVGIQRPKIIAANPMNPTPPVMFSSKRDHLGKGQKRSTEAGDQPSVDDVAIPDTEHIDTHRVGSLRMFTHGP